jgi:uncharacterized metal-binding protein
LFSCGDAGFLFTGTLLLLLLSLLLLLLFIVLLLPGIVGCVATLVVELLNVVLDRFNSEGPVFLWLNLKDDMCFRVVPGLGESALSTISSFTGASTDTFAFGTKST